MATLLGGEIAHHLADHVGVAGFLEFGCDDFLGIGVGGVAGQAELLGRPQSEQPVAARFGLELLLLVEGEFLLEAFLALVECGHDLRFLLAPIWAAGGLIAAAALAYLDTGANR